MGIVWQSVMRYIFIDLKYKFLLFSDVIWLVLDIVAFTFLGGMVDAAVEPNEYYHSFTIIDDGDFIAVDVYDSFANSYTGDQDIDHYITEEGTLSSWEAWETAGSSLDTIPNSTTAAGIWIDDVDVREYILNDPANTPYQDGTFWLSRDSISNGTHFMEIRFTDVKRTGTEDEERELKSFSTTFYVGNAFADNGSRDLYMNIIDFSRDGKVVMTLENGRENFDLSDGVLKFSVDGENEFVLNQSSSHENVRLLADNSVEIKNLERLDGKIDKGEHTITFKFTTEDGNTTFIGKKTFLVATEEWQNNDLGIDYSLKKFFLIGVLFWAFFAKAYEDTVNTIPDEAARGTIGFLITNNVNLSTLLVSRYISSSIKTFVMAMIFVFPIIAYQDISNFVCTHLWDSKPYPDSVFGGFSTEYAPYLILVIFIMWIFMLIFSVAISTLNIMFKRILPFAMMMVAGLKVLTGYYFPLEALETQLESLGGVADSIKLIPLVNGVYLIREMVVGKVEPEQIWARVYSMTRGTIYLAIFTLIFYRILEKKSRKWGTLEFY